MLLVLNKKIPEYIDYGILIPISPDKIKKTQEYLYSNKILKKYYKKITTKFNYNLINKKDLLRVHSAEYIEKLYSDKLTDEILKTYELYDKNGMPYRYDPTISKYPLKNLFKSTLYRITGSYLCIKNALQKEFCFYFGGGMHHAKRDYGEGFCLLNDVIIAIKKLQAENKIKKVWVIDVDVHKGDGTAALTENDDSIITLSVHMAKGWPLDKKKYATNGKLDPSFIPSKIDIPINKNEEGKYNNKLIKGLGRLLKNYQKPDVAVVLLGADPYKDDELPSSSDIKLSLSQIFERDKIIYNFLSDNKISQAYLMAGGYGSNSWKVYTQFLEWVLLKRLKLDNIEP